MKSPSPTPSHYKPEEKHSETFLVVDVDRDAAEVGARFRAYMTAQDGEDSQVAISAVSELPEYVLTWCDENVIVGREDGFAIAPEVLAHEDPLPAGYTGGGIAIEVHDEPPRRVLRVLKGRARACGDRINAEAPERPSLKVLGFRVVTRRTTDTSVAV